VAEDFLPRGQHVIEAGQKLVDRVFGARHPGPRTDSAAADKR
jgi:hypothetical protein